MHRRLLASLVVLSLSGCAMLMGGGKGGGQAATAYSPVDEAIDNHEQAIAEGKTPDAVGPIARLYTPSDRYSQTEDAPELRQKLQKIDVAWAQKIGPRAQQLIGDAHRTLTPDETLLQAAGKVYQACPTTYFDDSGTDHYYVLGQYAEFDKVVTEVLKSNPEAFHVWLQRMGKQPVDMVTYTLACEDHRQRELKKSDGVSESGPGPSSLSDYEKALLQMLPPFPKAKYTEDHEEVIGCGYNDYLIQEQYMGGGRFGDAELAELDGSPGWRPIKCNKFARPSRKYAREAAQAKNSLNHAGPGDLVYIPDDSTWQVERDGYNQIISRHLTGRVFRKQTHLKLFCASKNPFDSCYEGGAWVMLAYEATQQRLADAKRYASENKQVHCRVAAWAAYGLAGEPANLRDILQRDGMWVEDMRYVPKEGAPMDEKGLMHSSDQLRAEAKALYKKCGGSGSPPSGAEWSQVLTNQNHAPFNWAK